MLPFIFGDVYMTTKYYSYYDSPVGKIEIICTEDAVISLMFVDTERYICKTNNFTKNVIMQLDQYFKGTRQAFQLKIDLQGTNFQNKVWNELLKIPYGTTISYKDLAEKIGNINSSRAVGNANGKNIVWILIPCHRVVGSNGNLTGYAGGIDKKQWLLEHEASSFSICCNNEKSIASNI